jgi:uncharacterized protein (TIGR03083 family)
MTSEVASPLAALKAECKLVSETALVLPEESFSLQTRCTAWDVKGLLGHMYRDIDRLNVALSQGAPPEPDADSVSYWRSYDPLEDAPDIAERAQQVADSYPTGRALAGAWDEMWRKALDAAGAADPGRVVATWGPALTLNEFLKTRVLEITIHRMDLEDAFGRKGWGTEDAVSIVDDIMEGLLGAQPPSGLDWDVVDFIEIGAGRRPLAEAERETLGPLAERFPLMG